MYEYFKSKYPSLFANCQGGFAGFDCGDGWKDILERLFVKISKDVGVTISQVKEKSGGLRVYIDNGTDEAFTAINEAEDESFKTCECCGSKENVTTAGGWLKTLCSKCRK